MTETAPNADTGPRAGFTEWAGLAVLVVPCLVASMDISVLFLAVPFISTDLEPTASQLLWMTDIYGFLLAGLLIMMGNLGDRLGRKRLLLIGVAAFGIASVIAAYSTSATMLIAARAFLGLAGATLAPSTLSLIRNMFRNEKQRQVAIGIWSAGLAGGALLGPIVAGMLLASFWWGSVFLINVPVMAAVLLLAPGLLRESRDPEPGRFDPLSAVLSLAAVLPVIYGMKKLAEDGISWVPLVTIACGLVIGVVFIRRQRAHPNPMIDVRLFGNRSLSTGLLAGTLAMFAMVGFGLFISQYLQLIYGMPTFTAALWLLPSFGAMLVGASIAAPLVQNTRPAYVVGGALLLASAGCVVMTQVTVEGGLAALITGHGLLAGGVGVIMTLATDLVVGSAPAERAGVASALSETGSEFGGAFGIAALGSVGTAVYGVGVAGGLPAGLQDTAAEAAQRSLGEATMLARDLPDDVGAELLAVARDAFTSGIGTAALVCAVLMGCLAVAATALLWRTPRTGAPDASAVVSAKQG